MNTNETLGIGFFTSGTISFLHLEDLFLAFLLGFIGSFGAWVFKCALQKIKKGKK